MRSTQGSLLYQSAFFPSITFTLNFYRSQVALLAARMETIPRVSQEIASADGTRKLLLELKDGLEVPSYLC